MSDDGYLNQLAVQFDVVRDAVAERDRLRDDLEALRRTFSPDLVRQFEFEEAVAERDRLLARLAWLRGAYGKLWLGRAASKSIVEVYEDPQPIPLVPKVDYESLWAVMERVGQELGRVLDGDDLGVGARAALETVSINVDLVLGVGADDG